MRTMAIIIFSLVMLLIAWPSIKRSGIALRNYIKQKEVETDGNKEESNKTQE